MGMPLCNPSSISSVSELRRSPNRRRWVSDVVTMISVKWGPEASAATDVAALVPNRLKKLIKNRKSRFLGDMGSIYCVSPYHDTRLMSRLRVGGLVKVSIPPAGGVSCP